jgi:hypothetical protein
MPVCARGFLDALTYCHNTPKDRVSVLSLHAILGHSLVVKRLRFQGGNDDQCVVVMAILKTSQPYHHTP